MFEIVDGRTTDDRRRTDAGVTGILLAHPWAFGSGELKITTNEAGLFGTLHKDWRQIKNIYCTKQMVKESRLCNIGISQVNYPDKHDKKQNGPERSNIIKFQ